MIDPFFPDAPAGAVTITSNADQFYNCVGWAFHRNDVAIWPDEDEQLGWPPSIARQETVQAFIELFELAGFSQCGNGAFTRGFEKIAIYERKGVTKHVARQLAQPESFAGFWTSKLGPGADVRHNTAEVIQGATFGLIAAFMQRKLDRKKPVLPELHPKPARLVNSLGKTLVR